MPPLRRHLNHEKMRLKRTLLLSFFSYLDSSFPNFRKPPAFGGIGKDPLWKIDDSKLVGDIEAVQDSPTHVSIMPRTTMLLEKYETALACTQKDWEKVPEPESARDLS